MYGKEKERIENNTQRILRALREAGDEGLTNIELSRFALRYGGNLGELYKDGYSIRKESLGDGIYRYTLLSEPEVKPVRENVIDVLIREAKKAGIDSDKLIEVMNQNNIAVKYKANTYKAEV